jgi:cytochrome oxidase Cu insertion factor (SCO1/SenC/PrrC family)
MEARYFRWFGAIVCCAGILSMFPASAGAAGAAKDLFSAMRVRRIASPVTAGNLVLRSIEGRPIRLSDFRGKAVLVEFFLAN